MINELLIGLGLSILLGALIGAQREIRLQKKKINDFAGFRTFTLVSIMGYITGYLAFEILKNDLIILIGLIGMFAIGITAYKAILNISPKQITITTLISALITFLNGILISIHMYHIAITIAIIITTILFLGNALHKFAKKLKERDAFDTLKFAIISLVILPLLPNVNYSPLNFPIIGEILKQQSYISQQLLASLDVFNLFHIWLMVVFISGIAYFGYIMMITIGAQRGIVFTGFLGGFMSSTALTSSFAIESKRLTYLANPLAVGTIIACSTMFFRVLAEVAILNPELVPNILISFIIMGLVGYFGAGWIYIKTKLDHKKHIDIKSPFTLAPALKFALFFVIILFFSKLFSILYGEKGLYFVAFFSGIADVDAITISLSKLAANNSIANQTAEIGIIIAAFANTFVKGGIAYFLGTRKFSNQILWTFGAIITIGIIITIFI